MDTSENAIKVKKQTNSVIINNEIELVIGVILTPVLM
jgi:hypothetical protein